VPGTGFRHQLFLSVEDVLVPGIQVAEPGNLVLEVRDLAFQGGDGVRARIVPELGGEDLLALLFELLLLAPQDGGEQAGQAQPLEFRACGTF
jgi:hypothetical protein